MAKKTPPQSDYLRSLTYPPARLAGEDIRLLQRELTEAGYDPGPVDGVYGPRTRAALQAYIAAATPKVETAPVPPSERAARIIARAKVDWRAGVGEHDQSNAGGLSRIFFDSGWSLRVDKTASGRVKDWCGMSVAAWAHREGLAAGIRSSLYQTENVRSFFSYGEAGSVHHRTDRQATVAGETVSVLDLHKHKNSVRTWLESDALHAIELARWPLSPGMVLLIAHDGSRTRAHHITLVESWNGRELVTMEGNASGQSHEGKRIRQAVVQVTRDLTDPAVRRTIFGFGAFSDVDFDRTITYP